MWRSTSNCSLGDIVDACSVAICLLLVHRIDYSMLVAVNEEAVSGLYLDLSFVVRLGWGFLYIRTIGRI